MQSFYLFGSRVATHVVFWLLYYLMFGFIWANDGNYRDSYFLEFVLLPVRMMAVYLTIYLLIPKWLLKAHLIKLTLAYIALIVASATIQMMFTALFYQGLTVSADNFFELRGILRNVVLINSTVLFVSALKITQLWWQERDRVHELEKRLKDPIDPDFIEIKAEKRMHRISADELLYVEGLGNYVTFHTKDKKFISYTSLKQALDILPNYFQRIHKSFVVNTRKVNSYDQENVEINGKLLPVGRAFKEQLSIKN